jgi:TPR repeat protein
MNIRWVNQRRTGHVARRARNVCLALAICTALGLRLAAAGEADVSTWFFHAPVHVDDVRQLKRSATKGEVSAQLAYAKYLFDHGGKPLAIFWLTEANNQGNEQAEYLLGLLYAQGDGVAQDPDQSRYFLGKAADQNYGPAQYALGEMLLNAEFDDSDQQGNQDKALKAKISRGVSLLQRSATAGYAPAQYRLGLMYYNGEGVETDRRAALRAFVQAADQGVAAAAFMAARCYASGAGTRKDADAAKRYLLQTIKLAGSNSRYGRDAQAMISELPDRPSR